MQNNLMYPADQEQQNADSSGYINNLMKSGQNFLNNLTPPEAVGLGSMFVPVYGDALGLSADLTELATNPESRTPLNYGLTALGALPFVPSMLAMTKGFKVIEEIPHFSSPQKLSDALGSGWAGSVNLGKKARRRIMEELQEAGAEAKYSDEYIGDVINQAREIKKKKWARYNAKPKTDPLIWRSEQRALTLENFKKQNIKNRQINELSEALKKKYSLEIDPKDLLSDSYMGFPNTKRELLKNLKRKFQSKGWKLYHTSKGTDKKVSSYYFKKGNRKLRLSDHDLPMTMQRQDMRAHSGTPWDFDLNVSDLGGISWPKID